MNDKYFQDLVNRVMTGKVVSLHNEQFNHKQIIEFAYALSRNTTITELYMRYCRLDDFSVKAIAKALKYNQNLKILDLYGNIISENGAEDLVKAFKSNKTLTNIELGYNDINADASAALKLLTSRNKSYEKLQDMITKVASVVIKDADLNVVDGDPEQKQLNIEMKSAGDEMPQNDLN
jgi:Ran GTPase-activating protein (RanGAP) involved in mRNA processing and transport